MKRMSISVSHFSEMDLEILNTKKMKRMSTSVSHFPETDLDIRFTEKKKKNYKMDLNKQHSNI